MQALIGVARQIALPDSSILAFRVICFWTLEGGVLNWIHDTLMAHEEPTFLHDSHSRLMRALTSASSLTRCVTKAAFCGYQDTINGDAKIGAGRKAIILPCATAASAAQSHTMA